MSPRPVPPSSLSERVTRGDVFQLGCPSRDIMRHVTSRWGVLILIALQGGMHRFSDLRRKVSGVSERMLSQTLQWLEADGLVRRHALPVIPPHVEYTLTPLGEEAASKIAALADWIEENLGQLGSAETPAQDGEPARASASRGV